MDCVVLKDCEWFALDKDGNRMDPTNPYVDYTIRNVVHHALENNNYTDIHRMDRRPNHTMPTYVWDINEIEYINRTTTRKRTRSRSRERASKKIS